MAKQHRFYEHRYPSVGDYVVVKIKTIDDMGVNCELLEYNDIDGFIPFPELSTARIRSVAQITKVGNEEVATVLKVDDMKGF
jgi:translation initiation factor 2 alpha subunit (eIF-2alpha)